jgi:hypothetical protein
MTGTGTAGSLRD